MGWSAASREHVLAAFERNPATWVDWMMRFELGLEKPQPGRAVRSAGTIALSYIAGGMIPLAPYLITPQALVALRYSVVATIVALAVFGLCEGALHGGVAVEERVSHDAYRGAGGRGCVLDCKAIFGVAGS